MLEALKRFFFKEKPRKISTTFVHYDLQTFYQEINSQYFDSQLNLQICWFGRSSFIPKNRMVFGLYLPQYKLIKIHRLLDQKKIPEYFIKYIIYHEMLHEAVPPLTRKVGRGRVHHMQFLEKEKKFQEYALAQAFLKEWKQQGFYPPSLKK